METIKSHNAKFLPLEKSKFYATLLKQVDNYFETRKLKKTANTTMVIKTIVLALAYFLPFVAVLVFHLPFWALLLCYAVMGFAMAGIGMSVMHDANHGAYSRKKIINRLLGFSLNLLGMGVFNWKLQHNVLHHTYTNIYELDEDIDGPSILRLSPHHKYHKIHKYQQFYVFFLYCLLTLNWYLFKDFIQLVRYKKMGVNKSTPKQYAWQITSLILSKLFYAFYIIFIPIYWLNYDWQQIVIALLVLHFIAGFILSVTFQLAHTVSESSYPLPNEKNIITNDWAIHQVNTTVDFARNSKFLNWYLGGLNFQVEHHLFPTICHVHYKSLSKIVEETAKEFGIVYSANPTLMAAIKSHLANIKKLGSASV